MQEDILFSGFMLQWLEIARLTIALTTYSSYANIQMLYMEQIKRVKASTVIHYHVITHKVLKYAVKIDLIGSNPADKIEGPKMEKFIGSFYDSDEVEKLFEAAKGSLLEISIFLGAFYGL